MTVAGDESFSFADHCSDAVAESPPSSFITELFFLLNAYQHLGMNKAVNNRDRGQKNIGEIKKELKKAEAAKPSWGEGVRGFVGSVV